MCDEREPLLAYLYGEADGAERRRVEEHLESCHTCRDELAGLRSVRQDLLAWDVPDHGSVWRPFTPARPTWAWRDVPAWTLAAAACVMLAIGATGGVAANALASGSPRDVRVAPQSVPVTAEHAVVTPVTPAQLSAFESRVLRQVQAQVPVAPPVASGVMPVSLTSSQYDALLQIIREQHGMIVSSTGTIEQLQHRLNDLSARVDQLQSQPGGGQPGGR